MYDFIFYNPTKILFGAKETLIGSELQADGIKKILLLSGMGSAERSGLLGRVRENLRHKDILFHEFNGVSSNPLLSHTRAGIALAKENGVDAILAVGGGSVLDEAKAIAVGAIEKNDIWDFFIGAEVTGALPVYSILTLAATGSEMNGNSVITNAETKQKYNIASPHIYPRCSILNPELTLTVPADYSAYSAVDVIAHVIEAYFTKQPGTRLQDRLVEAIIHTVIETQNIISKDPGNYDARAQFMWTATLALNGLTPAGVGEYGFPNHMIEHSLSAIYNIPHGAGLAVVIPAWMRWYRPQNTAQFERFAREIFQKQTAEEGIKALEEWFLSIDAPTRLGAAGIPAEDIDAIAENAAQTAILWGEAETYNKGVIADILRRAV